MIIIRSARRYRWPFCSRREPHCDVSASLIIWQHTNWVCLLLIRRLEALNFIETERIGRGYSIRLTHFGTMIEDVDVIRRDKTKSRSLHQDVVALWTMGRWGAGARYPRKRSGESACYCFWQPTMHRAGLRRDNNLMIMLMLYRHSSENKATVVPPM